MKQLVVGNSFFSDFSDKLYFSVFQKYNSNSLIRFFILCSYSDLWQLSATIVVAMFLIGLIGLFFYFSFQFQEKTLTTNSAKFEEKGYSEDSASSESQEQFEEESSEDSTDSEEAALFSRNIDNFFADLVFDRVLAHIVNQVDAWTFQARFSGSNLIVMCYLRPELYSNLTRPLVGSLVRLEYNYYSFGSKGYGYYIIQVIDSNIKEGAPWRWNYVYAEVIGEDEDRGKRVVYARLLESEEVVLCQVYDYLRDTIIEKDYLVYLEVNERNRTYFIVEIVERCDSGGIP